MKSGIVTYMKLENVIISDLINGDYKVTFHAHVRMSERNITRYDISDCAQTGVLTFKDNKYHIVGKDSSGESMKIVCVYEDGVLIITVI